MRFTTDKVTFHGYLPAYLKIAERLGTAARVCEVGVYRGGSLDMWQALFPDGLVAGVDRDPDAFWPEGTHRILMDQDSPALPVAVGQVSAEWDLIVDDASHLGAVTEETFRLLWPMVAPGGLYVVEDWTVGLPGCVAADDSMLKAVERLLLRLERGSDTVSVTCTSGLAIVEKRA